MTKNADFNLDSFLIDNVGEYAVLDDMCFFVLPSFLFHAWWRPGVQDVKVTKPTPLPHPQGQFPKTDDDSNEEENKRPPSADGLANTDTDCWSKQKAVN